MNKESFELDQKKFYQALKDDNCEVIKDLIDEGFDVQEAFFKVVFSKFDCLSITKFLIENGADVNYAYPSRDNKTALHIVAAWGSTCLKKLKLLVTIKNCTIDAQDNNGLTPLFCAVSTRSKEAGKVLIDAGCDLDTIDKSGNTVLYDVISCHWCPKNVLVYVTKNNINLKNMDGYAPIHLALKKNRSLEIIQNLKESGADFTIKNSENKNAYELIEENSTLYGSLKETISKD